jgi:hypothetical protein
MINFINYSLINISLINLMINFKKFTSTPSYSVTTLGLSVGTSYTATLASFVSGDRGCLPYLANVVTPVVPVAGSAAAASVVAASGTTQAVASSSSITPWVIGSLTSTSQLSNMITDAIALHLAICVTYGSCCYTSNCNSAGTIKINIISLVLALVLSLIYL